MEADLGDVVERTLVVDNDGPKANSSVLGTDHPGEETQQALAGVAVVRDLRAARVPGSQDDAGVVTRRGRTLVTASNRCRRSRTRTSPSRSNAVVAEDATPHGNCA
jgi:hypothetical protein